MIILNDLEPLRHKSFDEVETLRKEGLVPQEVAILKSDFSAFSRFERENDNILEFVNIPYRRK